MLRSSAALRPLFGYIRLSRKGRSTASFGLCFCSLLITPVLRSADAPNFKSSAVRTARTAMDGAVAAARREFNAKYQAAQINYAGALETAIDKFTRDGDLPEANKLSLELVTIRGAPYAGDVPSLIGVWRMRWGVNGFTDYTFAAGGNVSRVLQDAEPRGILRRIGDELALDFGDGSLMRVNLAGERMFIEYWNNTADFPRRYPDQIGVGVRAPQ